ncbi:uncharacterized protein RBU33_013040 [Hipposideros larvatus]
MRAAPAPPGLAGLVRAHARCPPEASGCAERARAARRRTCEVSPEEREGGWVRGARGLGRFNPLLGSASRPGRALRASYSGDEAALRAPSAERRCRRTPPLFDHNKGWILTQQAPRTSVAFRHCGPCLCLLFWNVLGVLTPDTDLQIQETPLSGR